MIKGIALALLCAGAAALAWHFAPVSFQSYAALPRPVFETAPAVSGKDVYQADIFGFKLGMTRADALRKVQALGLQLDLMSATPETKVQVDKDRTNYGLSLVSPAYNAYFGLTFVSVKNGPLQLARVQYSGLPADSVNANDTSRHAWVADNFAAAIENYGLPAASREAEKCLSEETTVDATWKTKSTAQPAPGGDEPNYAVLHFAPEIHGEGKDCHASLTVTMVDEGVYRSPDN